MSVITHQPGLNSYVTKVPRGEWSTGLCACTKDMHTLMFCFGVAVLFKNLPGGFTALRTHMRLTYGIEDTVTNDALMMLFCGYCEMCRMTREVLIRKGIVSL
ncbi:cornifelin-like [Antennarius striatus]|uniref:cornifelin-like n=1 Tax=Antennarius striatus TaxID=241820 RepID=UPI0035B0D2B0